MVVPSCLAQHSYGCRCCSSIVAWATPRLELPRRLHRPLPINQDAPALASDGAAAKACDDGLEAALAARVLEHGVVKGARLQPDGRDAELLRLVENLEGGGGRGDDGDGGLLGVGQGGEVGDRGVVLAGGVDGVGGRVDGRRGDVVVEVPGEDWGFYVSGAVGCLVRGQARL